MRLHDLHHPSHRDLRRGFSFTEILFAVMVLGVGFIMIAAMFPVALRQTQTTMEETHGANQGREALAYLQSIASEALFPVTTPSAPLSGFSKPALVTRLNVDFPANAISTGNKRLGWTALYMRGYDGDGAVLPYAQVFLIPMQSRHRQQYLNRATTSPAVQRSDYDPARSTFIPHKCQVGVGMGYIQLGKDSEGSGFEAMKAAGPGAYVVIANDDSGAGRSNGRVYRLGSPIDADNGKYELSPGFDMISIGSSIDDNVLSLEDTSGFLIGKGYNDETSAYEGNTQDIGLYIGFIRIPPKVK